MSTLKRSSSASYIPVLRKEGSTIPVLKREGSFSSLSKRESRPAVRQSQQSLQKRVSRSVDRYSHHKIGTPLVSKGRASNYLTPLTSNTLKKTRSSSKSPVSSAVKKVDKRPINDKEWQKQQLIKVQNFLFTRFQVTEKVKPGFSIEIFVTVVNLLFKAIDKRINITKENYIEEVPTRLKCYRYPSAVKPSLMKTVNAPHSWAQIIAILSWLVELIEKLDAMKGNLALPDSINAVDKKKIMELFVFNARSSLLKQKNEDETEIYKEYEANLCEIYEINQESLLKCKAEIEHLKERVENMTIQEENILKTNQDYKEKILEIEKKMEDQKCLQNLKADNVKQSQQEWQEKRRIADGKREKLLESIKNLKERIAIQPYSAKYVKYINQKLVELKYTKNLREERLAKLKEISDKYDLKLAEDRRNVQTTVYKINCIIKDAKRIKPDFNVDTLRETRFTDPEFLKEIENFKVQYEQEKGKNVKELGNLKELLQKQLDLKLKVSNKLDQATKEVRQLEAEIDACEKEAFESQCLQKNEIKKMEKDLQESAKELEIIEEQYREQKEKLRLLEKQLEEQLKRKEQAECALKETQKGNVEQIAKACMLVSQNRTKERQLLVDLNRKVVAADMALERRAEEFLVALQNMDKQLTEMRGAAEKE